MGCSFYKGKMILLLNLPNSFLFLIITQDLAEVYNTVRLRWRKRLNCQTYLGASTLIANDSDHSHTSKSFLVVFAC